MLSPVWRAKLCRPINARDSRVLHLEPGDALIFPKLITLSCGQPTTAASFGELLDIGRLADCYGLAAVCEAVEWHAGLNLTVERAAEVLASRVTGGLARLRDASKELALSRFEAFAATDGFLRLEEQELGSLLDEGQVEAEGEERVFEAVARWMRGGGAARGRPLRGEGLLRKVRFGAMGTEYLKGPGREVLGDSGLVGELVEAALASRLDELASEPIGEGRTEAMRRPVAIGWGRYIGQGDASAILGRASSEYVFGLLGTVTAVTCCSGRDGQYTCWGTSSGEIEVAVRDGRTLRRIKDLRPVKYSSIPSMATWMGLAVSGNSKGTIRVWDVERGTCLTAEQAHEGTVTALAVCGDGRWLVSGSSCGEAACWSAGTEPRVLVRERVRSLAKEGGQGVRCLASLGGDRVAVGSPLQVVVWNVASNTLDRTLDVCRRRFEGRFVVPDEGLQALAVDGGRLVGTDGRTIMVWSVDEGAMLFAAEAYPEGSPQRLQRLAVHAGKLVTGSKAKGEGQGCEVCVRDLETLRLEHVLPQGASSGMGVTALVASRGCVWGSTGRDRLVWGVGDSNRPGLGPALVPADPPAAALLQATGLAGLAAGVEWLWRLVADRFAQDA